MGTLIDAAPDIDVVAEVDSVDDAVEACRLRCPDVVLLDVDKSDAPRVDDMQRLRRELPHGALVVLARRDDDEEIFRAVVGGAAGHVGDKAAPSELLDTIRAAASGAEPIQQTLASRPAVARRVLETFALLVRRSAASEARDDGELSNRERRILELAAVGMTNFEIGREMGVSEHTVKGAISQLLARFRLRHRTEAVVHALRLGWIAGPTVEPQRVEAQRVLGSGSKPKRQT